MKPKNDLSRSIKSERIRSRVARDASAKRSTNSRRRTDAAAGNCLSVKGLKSGGARKSVGLEQTGPNQENLRRVNLPKPMGIRS